MAYFGISALGGSEATVPRADMPGEYSQGFAKGQRFGFEELEAQRRTAQEQARLAEALRAQAEGRTPSLAALQYASALEQSQAAAASQLASARGMSPAAAQRLLLTQQAGARAAAAGKSAELRLMEQQAAQANLGTLLSQQRQQTLIGSQLAGGLGSQAGELGYKLQQLEQERLLEQQKIRRQEEAATEGAITGVAQSLGAGYVKGAAKPGGEQTAPISEPKVASKGGEIKGRTKFNGDTRSNDTVPAMLSPGEIVLPRSVAQAEDAPEKSKKFVEAIKGRKKSDKKSLAVALARIQELESRLNAMEALADLEAEERG